MGRSGSAAVVVLFDSWNSLSARRADSQECCRSAGAWPDTGDRSRALFEGNTERVDLLDVQGSTSVVRIAAEHECSVCGLGSRYCVLSIRLSVPREGNTPHRQELGGEKLGLTNGPVTASKVKKQENKRTGR